MPTQSASTSKFRLRRKCSTKTSVSNKIDNETKSLEVTNNACNNVDFTTNNKTIIFSTSESIPQATVFDKNNVLLPIPRDAQVRNNKSISIMRSTSEEVR